MASATTLFLQNGIRSGWIDSGHCGRFGGNLRLFHRSIEESQKKQNWTIACRQDLNADTFISTFPSPLRDGTAPLVNALKTTAEQDVARFHFPGHNRGQAAPSSLTQLIGIQPFLHDLPELPELDDLFSPKGAILDAQKRASNLFGSSETWFLVGGTTCGIHAAIMSTCSPGDTLILPRNSHISAMSGMVLSGVIPNYILPEYNSQWDIAGGITPSQIKEAIEDLKSEGRSVSAVLVTSPTYEGICSDLSNIVKLCHSYGIPVIVDEAHGAHFRFHHQMPCTALEQGADIVVQSTHKVLCSLTQSSMLHMSGDIVDREKICRCLQMLQSTSPSYLLLASLDAARAQLGEDPDTIFNKSMELAGEGRNQIKTIPGITVLNMLNFSNFPAMDPLRLTVGVWQLGISGYEADEVLCDEHGVICEVAGRQSLTFAITLGTHKQHIQRLLLGLEHLSSMSLLKNGLDERRVEDGVYAPFDDITMSLSPREAFFARKRKVSTGKCLGEICGELICSYPPGIPVLIPGEIITERALSYLLDVRKIGAVISGAADPELSTIVVCK
ncbi:arginine decarboxylase-like protein isoform X1 [Cinnamomum micranthum f. kanehirae]|uniref:Arginine decarboxylase-like protein isoform X1 n=1 Tax=Cinnamomum micranthum f. kanehirae TaxID=337451 RepID=A0A3S3M011_9MAGN|nr:arginine decarboxylase-like protein isoform X1 [Cinnamomum micranthum f. kanehirae]